MAVSLAGPAWAWRSLLGMAGLAYWWAIAPAAFCWGNFLAYSVLLWVVLSYFVRGSRSQAGASCSNGAVAVGSARAVYAGADVGLHDRRGVGARRWCAGGWVVLNKAARPPAGRLRLGPAGACMALVAPGGRSI